MASSSNFPNSGAGSHQFVLTQNSRRVNCSIYNDPGVNGAGDFLYILVDDSLIADATSYTVIIRPYSMFVPDGPTWDSKISIYWPTNNGVSKAVVTEYTE